MRKIIIDVDAGVDDAIAIMMALANPNVEVLGITCCYGNTSVENVLRNVLRVLKVCGRPNIPVYRGCSKPRVDYENRADDFFGTDGFGDVPDPHAPGLDRVEEKKAEQAIIDLVNENAKQVILVATAPLTNLAAAVKLDPSLPKKLKALYIMGGNTESRGNVTVCGEFNFVCDPEAAYIVLDHYTCPTYIASWEFTRNNSLPWSFFDDDLSGRSEKSTFLERILHISRMTCESRDENFNPCDAYAMAAAINNAIITDREMVAVTVELQGKYTRGMMVLDRDEKLRKEHRVIIMKKVNSEMFRQMLINAVA